MPLISVPEPHYGIVRISHFVSLLTSSSSRKLFTCVVVFQTQVSIGDTVNITITDAVYHGTSLLLTFFLVVD
jgi:hypothetical protein